MPTKSNAAFSDALSTCSSRDEIHSMFHLQPLQCLIMQQTIDWGWTHKKNKLVDIQARSVFIDTICRLDSIERDDSLICQHTGMYSCIHCNHSVKVCLYWRCRSTFTFQKSCCHKKPQSMTGYAHWDWEEPFSNGYSCRHTFNTVTETIVDLLDTGTLKTATKSEINVKNICQPK